MLWARAAVGNVSVLPACPTDRMLVGDISYSFFFHLFIFTKFLMILISNNSSKRLPRFFLIVMHLTTQGNRFVINIIFANK